MINNDKYEILVSLVNDYEARFTNPHAHCLG